MAPTEQPDLMAFLRRHQRTVRLCLLGAVLGGVAGMFASRWAPRWYRATARLAVPPLDNPVGPQVTEALSGANANLSNFAAVLHTRSACIEVATRLGLARHFAVESDQAAGERLEKNVKVDSESRWVIGVSVEDQDARWAVEIEKALVTVASERTAELWGARNRGHGQELERMVGEAEKRLSAAEDAMRKFSEENHVVDLKEQTHASVEQAAALEKLRIEKELGLHFADGYGSEASQEVTRFRRERAGAQQQLDALVRQSKNHSVLLPLDALPRLAIEHARLERAVQAASASYELLRKEREQIRAVEARPVGQPQFIDYPVESWEPVRPGRLRFGVLGGLAGGLLVLLLLLNVPAARRLDPVRFRLTAELLAGISPHAG